MAIVHEEPEASRFLVAIAAQAVVLISAGTLIELTIVADNKDGLVSGENLDRFLFRLGTKLEIVPVDRQHVEIARAAYRRFGKGNDPAALNFGDCFAYALAKERNLPLLFKGNDFSRTDIAAA
jgi:ribonuclease VapC